MSVIILTKRFQKKYTEMQEGFLMNTNDHSHRDLLKKIAHRVMLERGLLPDFSAAALAELSRFQGPAAAGSASVRDMRGLLWASIDNDDSRDLDQLTVAETPPGDKVKILVAVADLDLGLASAIGVSNNAPAARVTAPAAASRRK